MHGLCKPSQGNCRTQVSFEENAQEQPDLSALEHHIREVPWPQLMEECVLGCLAAACAGLESADVLRAYRQV